VSKLSKEKQEKLVLRGSRYIAIATQLPFVVLAGYGIGYFLDTKFGTTWLSLVFLIAAIVGRLVPSPPLPGEAVPVTPRHREILDRDRK